MAYYETVFITRQDLSKKQNETLAEEMTKLVESNDGKVINTEFWGLLQLAYQIKKNKKGHYTLFHIDGEATAVNELERNLRQHEDVLRFQTLRLEEKPEGDTIFMERVKQGEAA